MAYKLGYTDARVLTSTDQIESILCLGALLTTRSACILVSTDADWVGEEGRMIRANCLVNPFFVQQSLQFEAWLGTVRRHIHHVILRVLSHSLLLSFGACIACGGIGPFPFHSASLFCSFA